MAGDGAMHGREACMVGGHAWWGWVCVAGGCVQERQPLKQAVRILLEYILVKDDFGAKKSVG